MHEESFEGVGLSSNVYILKSNDKYCIFDTSGHPDLIDFLVKAGINREKIVGAFLTHGHFDHVMGICSLNRYNIKCYIDYSDLYLLHVNSVLDIHDGEKLLEEFGLRSIHTPGHTPGSTCFYSESEAFLISGDTVFSDGCFGRTDLPGGNNDDMKSSLRLLSSLKIESIFPGHGGYIRKDGSKIIKIALSNAEILL
ncbi:MAG: MBL fold metallo-hydrolase [Candidatus Methanomethyliaceae archaeon]|nr:MBL fold metallo-hydrolase [Candidatus Methanomethyliaceae archaeon]MCX8170224.1 MBL fold metallo-hydrolase [Candidatus Methanomethyliaceae archaeon]MDW7970333.1 MBL fold metallo-hydrolase [Nitrososphaerota archaeon]